MCLVRLLDEFGGSRNNANCSEGSYASGKLAVVAFANQAAKKSAQEVVANATAQLAELVRPGWKIEVKSQSASCRRWRSSASGATS